MWSPDAVSRRKVLLGSAVTVAGVALAGCTGSSRDDGGAEASSSGSKGVGSSTKPLPVPTRFGEAPALAAQVKAGDLPPVEDRLPTKPYVVPHKWLQPGNYGGTLQLITADTADLANAEYMYGHSPLRYLNDSADIGPGLLESWEANGDASEWTLHFRAGLRWSDGAPCTTEDVMFWWEDMILDEEHPAEPGSDVRSAKGTVATFTAKDAQTLVVTFDAPTPLFPDQLATWVKRGNGSSWVEPKHYLKQFHPRYNNSVTGTWIETFEQKRSYWLNPESPTMTGWRLVSFAEGQNLAWERNPYYWCVDKEGNQLPYIDKVSMTAVADPNVARLQIQQGNADYVHGPFLGLSLTDISGFKQSEATSNARVLVWDSGSGTGSTFVLNYDYPEPKLRALFRNPKFRQALSLAFNREEVRKSVYFNTGEITTGTMSPKASEYQVEPEGLRSYRTWRDSFVDYDPERAARMLDELGVVDSNGDGKRELPDGSELFIRFDYPADLAEEHRQKNQLLAKDWAKIGIDTEDNPVSPAAFMEQWEFGQLMTDASRIGGDGPNHVVFASWLVPTEAQRFAPLQGQYYLARGTPLEKAEADVDPYERQPPRMEPEPGSVVDRLWKLYDQAKVEVDGAKRNHLVYEMIKIHISEGPFFMGSVANTPQLVVVNKDLRNVPEKANLAQGGYVNPWTHPNPAVYDPEAYFWTNPDQHTR